MIARHSVLQFPSGDNRQQRREKTKGKCNDDGSKYPENDKSRSFKHIQCLHLNNYSIVISRFCFSLRAMFTFRVEDSSFFCVSASDKRRKFLHAFSCTP
jgi:hypothetical protein